MIREICSEDKNAYFEMSRSFYSSGAALKQIDDGKRESFWNTIVEARYVKGYILEDGGNIAGYALTVPYASQEFGGIVLWIDELYVKPEFRGRGIASKFFRFAEALSGKTLLRLEVEPDNMRALKLYERTGFTRLPYLQMIKENN